MCLLDLGIFIRSDEGLGVKKSALETLCGGQYKVSILLI